MHSNRQQSRIHYNKDQTNAPLGTCRLTGQKSGQLEGNGIPFGQSKREGKKNSSRRREQGKNYTVEVGSRREPDVAADFHKEAKEKIW